MRKKIFIIHGNGMRNGLGKEQGGDLDTVASNAFYGAWIDAEMEKEGKDEAEYGEDYEYDYVNYQQGIRHLDVHEGCDVYLPDFPIDALPPRLTMKKIDRDEEVDLRAGLFSDLDRVRRLVFSNHHIFTEDWKNAYNDLKKQFDKISKNREFYELKMLRHYVGILSGLLETIVENEAIGDDYADLESYLWGDKYNKINDLLKENVESNLKREIVGQVPKFQVRQRLMLDDSARFDFGCIARLKWHQQLLGVWVEAASVISSTAFVMAGLGKTLSDENRQDIDGWLNDIREPILENNRELVAKIREIIGENHRDEVEEHCREIIGFWEEVSVDWLLEQKHSDSSRLKVMVLEQTSGRPVPDLEVVFDVEHGDVKLAPVNSPDNRVGSIAIATDERGMAQVLFFNQEETHDYGITATHNDLNFVTYPEELGVTEDYYKDHPGVDAVELRVGRYLDESGGDEGDQGVYDVYDAEENHAEVEGGPVASDRATRLACDLLESDLRYLAEKDVRLVRIDDHHPYTPEILETLENLREEGIIAEEIRLSSLPRGEHQPKEEQLCGADLVYDGFIRDTEADNPGMAELCNKAHHQDLHIQPIPELSIELSKLIGSKFSKVEMCHGLRTLKTKPDMLDVMENTGWDKVVEEYESGLEKVLPRVEKCLYRMEFVEPPEDRIYEDKVGWKKWLRFMELLFGGDAEKQQAYREVYAQQHDKKVTAYTCMSPFSNPKLGEPSINVASALNYLKRRYTDIDYYFHAWGTFLYSTRRVNEKGYEINLSDLVSKIGSPSDGGHPAAATGSPESNPGFPSGRFQRVDVNNFAEYLYYIAGIIEEATGLELLNISEQYPEDFEDGMGSLFYQLEKNVYRLTLSGPDGSVNVCVVRAVYGDDGGPSMTMPLALAHLRRAYPMDYFFYSVSPGKLVMRNVKDYEQIMDLDQIAGILGTFRDGGHAKAALCQPKFNPEFDEKEFRYVNWKNMKDYVDYLGTRIVEGTDFQRHSVSQG